MENEGENQVKVEKTAEPKVESTEATTSAQTTEVAEDVGKRIEEIQKELEKAKQEALAHQKNVSKKDAELQRFKQFDTRVTGIEQKLDIVAGMIADVLDKGGEEPEETEKTKQRRSSEYLAKLKEVGETAQKQSRQEIEAEQNMVASEIQALAKSVNLDINADEFAKAQLIWRNGDLQGSLNEVKKVVEAKKVVEKPKETEAEIEARLIKKILKERGELQTETGQPSGGALSDAEFVKKFGSGELPYTKANAERVKKIQSQY